MAIAIAALIVAVLVPTPNSHPSFSLGNPWVLRAEWGLAVLLALLIVLAILWHGIGEGEMPTEITREGFKWKKVNTDTARALGALGEELKAQQAAVQGMDIALNQAGGVIAQLNDRVAGLEAAVYGVPQPQEPDQG